MDFRLYISIRYIGGNRIRGKDLNNKNSILKTLSTNSKVVERIENKKLKRLIYYLN